MEPDAAATSEAEHTFDTFPPLKNSRRGRMRRTSVSNKRAEGCVFRFSFKNIHRSYSNVIEIVTDTVEVHSDLRIRHKRAVTLPNGTFCIRILPPPGVNKKDEEKKHEHAKVVLKKDSKQKQDSRRLSKGTKKHLRQMAAMRDGKQSGEGTSRGKKKRRGKNKNAFVDLVCHHFDLYILGFIHGGTFYKLKEDSMNSDPVEEEIEKEFEDENVVEIPFDGSYRGLGISFREDIPIGVPAVFEMYNNLSSYKVLMEEGRLHLVRRALATAVFMFSEGLRFPKLQQFIHYSLSTWYNTYQNNNLIPAHIASVYVHRWAWYSDILRGDVVFDSTTCYFDTFEELLDFVGLVKRKMKKQ